MFNRNSIRNLGIAGLFILGATFGLRQIHISSGGYANYPARVISGDERSVQISIPAGAVGTQIGELLFKNGVVASSESFFRAAVANSKSSSIAPGTHSLSLRISGAMAVEQLLDAQRIVDLIKINEGAWNSEVFSAMVSSKHWSENPSSYAAKVALPAGVTSLEGVLFPAQYSFADGTTQLAALQSMVTKFSQVIATTWRS